MVKSEVYIFKCVCVCVRESEFKFADKFYQTCFHVIFPRILEQKIVWIKVHLSIDVYIVHTYCREMWRRVYIISLRKRLC